jgi:methylamine dehydrogenase heavy chain
VVEIHDSETLELKAEIEIPPKHAQAIPYRGMLTTSNDGRFLYIQNATPATSVSVVDLQQKKFVSEIQTPGCWSIHPWAEGYRFSAICGDGTLQTIKLDDSGKQIARSRSAKFFDPDKDPIFIHPERLGEQRYFVSFHSNVYSVKLAGDEPTFEAPWSLLDAKDKKQGWRPGGYQMTAVHRASGVMFVGLHDHGYEGSHKNPAKEIWAFDLATKKRIARMPASSAVALVASQGDDARLFSLDGEKNAIDIRAIKPGYPKVDRIEGVGETPMVMEVN